MGGNALLALVLSRECVQQVLLHGYVVGGCAIAFEINPSWEELVKGTWVENAARYEVGTWGRVVGEWKMTGRDWECGVRGVRSEVGTEGVCKYSEVRSVRGVWSEV